MMKLIHSHVMQILLQGRSGIGCAIVLDEDGEPDYEQLFWESETYSKPTAEEFAEAVRIAKTMNYQEQRIEAYPTIQEQLDSLFHNGYDGWKSQIQEIKDRYPKP